MAAGVDPSIESGDSAWLERLDTLRESGAYRAYLRVRREVLSLLSLGQNRRTTGHAPSDYWSGELSRFEYMLDASPLVIEQLRHHTHNLTGLLPQHYRESLESKKTQFAEKLAALRGLSAAAAFGVWSDTITGWSILLRLAWFALAPVLLVGWW